MPQNFPSEILTETHRSEGNLPVNQNLMSQNIVLNNAEKYSKNGYLCVS